MSIFIAALFGLVIGSFLSVCIYRIPRSRAEALLEEELGEEKIPVENLSFTNPPRSICRACGKQLLWWHNVPVLSWILLGGKCAFCGERISLRYPLVEALSGAAAVLSVIWFGPTATAAAAYLFCATLIVISFIDYDFFIIPNVISLPGTAVGLVVGVINHFTHWFAPPFAQSVTGSLLGAFIGGGILLAISEFYLRVRKREGLGMGDVKLLAMTGAFFGIEGALATIFIGSLVGSIGGLFLILVTRRSFAQALPFGPYLAIGTIVYIFTFEHLPFPFTPIGVR